MYVIEGIVDCDFLKPNRGYYVDARRCEISLRVSENAIPERLRTLNSFPQAIIFQYISTRTNGKRKARSKPVCKSNRRASKEREDVISKQKLRSSR